jgi:hypothetical protein
MNQSRNGNEAIQTPFFSRTNNGKKPSLLVGEIREEPERESLLGKLQDDGMISMRGEDTDNKTFSTSRS